MELGIPVLQWYHGSSGYLGYPWCCFASLLLRKTGGQPRVHADADDAEGCTGGEQLPPSEKAGVNQGSRIVGDKGGGVAHCSEFGADDGL